jgi:hypothetical protein
MICVSPGPNAFTFIASFIHISYSIEHHDGQLRPRKVGLAVAALQVWFQGTIAGPNLQRFPSVIVIPRCV